MAKPLFTISYKWLAMAILCFAFAKKASSQTEIYHYYHDDLTYYFGISLGYSSSQVQMNKSDKFLQNDSILSAVPRASGGIALGLLATGRLTDHWQVRINPKLIVAGTRYIDYRLGTTQTGEHSIQNQVLPFTIISLPIQMKFQSDRIGNFRTYLMGGLKYDIDLSSNSTARNAEDLLKLKKYDFGYELGLGFNFYLPFVTISPEIKISNGLSNIHQPDPALKYSHNLDRILSRMVMFSIHFED